MKRLASLVVKVALTVIALWCLARTVDLRAALAAAAALTPTMMLAGLALLLSHVLVCAARWVVVVRAIGGSLPFSDACALSWIGNFFGQVLPGGIGGDAVRMWKAHRAGLPLAVAFNSIALDRVVTLFGLLLLVTVMQPLFPFRRPVWSVWLFPALTLAGAAGIAALTCLDRIPVVLRRARLIRGLAALAVDSRRLFLTARYVVPVLAITLLAHVILALVVWTLGKGIGANLSALDAIALFPQVFFFATLPISIAGWGVRETAMVVLLGYAGVSPDHAVAMSVLFGLGIIVTALPGSAFLILSKDRRSVGLADPRRLS